MTRHLKVAIIPSAVRLLAGVCAALAIGAQAAPYELRYTGSFSNAEALNLATASNPRFFNDWTPFTLRAWFDDSTPNLAPPFGGPFDGFRAYAPSAATFEIGGAVYTMSLADNPKLTVSIFDRNSFDPGHYAVGIIIDAFADGAGIVGDFLSASPNFTAAALTPTQYADFYGVGHASGVCLSGNPPDCPHAVEPLVLRDSGNGAWNLTLGNFEADYPVAHRPGAEVGPLNTAQIVAVPEPSTYGLMLTGLFGMGCLARRRSR
ncbi:MAG: PEP-CTERM sorting domain-containing protein [Bacteriovorax sp.]|nr:PEP-CTERM sorting domain-containing protein [Rhizobacter sp.]